jgi:uncharacterized protein (TIGR02246 family)
MIRKALLPVCCVLALTLASCSEAPPPAAPDTRAADEKAIRDLIARNEKDWAAKDVDKIVGYYSSDAMLLVPDMKMVMGTADLKGAAKSFLDANFSFQGGPGIKVEVSKASDLAYATGTYMSKMADPKTKKLMAEEGKWATVFKKQADGSWKAVVDMFNADGPAVPAK